MTTMKIEIEAHQLVAILIEAGIPDTDAKSLVFDILSAQSGIALMRREPEPEPERLVKRPVQQKPIPQRLVIDAPEPIKYEEEEEEEEIVEPKIRTTKVSYPSQNAQPKIDFSNFGGNYNGIAKR